jgi:hypothetical protein
MNKLSNYATTVASGGDGAMRVVYHNTCIVEWTDRGVTLNTGGWRTVTTKRKMEQASRQFNLGYSIYAKDFAWFVRLPNGKEVQFEDDTLTFARVRA